MRPVQWGGPSVARRAWSALPEPWTRPHQFSGQEATGTSVHRLLRWLHLPRQEAYVHAPLLGRPHLDASTTTRHEKVDSPGYVSAAVGPG